MSVRPRLLFLVLALVLVVVLALLPLRPSSRDSLICQRFGLTQGDVTLALPYCSNKPLDAPDAAVTRVIVVIHGDSRNADDHLGYIARAAEAAGAKDTLIIAPQFLTSEDLDAHALPSDTLYWSSGGWKEGNLSQDSPSPRPWRISSFTVLDRLLQEVANRALFPNLAWIVVAGHSAGGQYANRFAAGTQIDKVVNDPGITYRYIVSNPSSYLYFNGDRRKAKKLNQFGPLTADQIHKCPDYNQYKFGVEGLNSYMSSVGETALREQYRARKVVYLLGALDIDMTDPSLDTTCPANWQGAQRLERGTIYYNYLRYLFGSTVSRSHLLSVVPGVGHDAQAMYNSPQGLLYLFGA